MPKTISVTRKMVDLTAFELVRREGMEALTARNVAQAAGCSTQPIYKHYRNLEALRSRVIDLVADCANELIYRYRKTGVPFLDTGLGFVRFAAEERVLFRIFCIDNSLSDPVFGPMEDRYLFGLMEDLLGDAPLDAGARRTLYEDTMIYTGGLAHMAYAGQLNLSEEQLAERLMGAFRQFAGSAWKGGAAR